MAAGRGGTAARRARGAWRAGAGLPGSRTPAVWLAVWLALLGLLTLLTFATDLVLISTLGVVVVLAGLISPPRVVLLVSAVALGFALALVLFDDALDQAWLRVVNVGVGSLLGLGAAMTRHLMLRRIRGLQERDAALLAALPDAVVLIDPDGRLVFANDAAQAVLGTRVPPGADLHEVLVHRDADGARCSGRCPLAGVLPDSGDGRADGLAHRLTPAAGEDRLVDWSAVPVRDRRGLRTDGGTVLVLRDAGPRLLVAEQTAELLAARRETAVQRHYLEVLERALRPPGPQVAGLDVGVAYAPAEPGAPTGGDHVDSMVLPDGRLFVVVVDAVGHGVTSTRDALLVTHAARALVGTGVPIGELAGRLDAMDLSRGEEPVTATLVAVVLDPRSGEVEVAAAGHPPVLLVRADGDVQWLESPGRPVGFPMAGTDLVVGSTLGEGDTVVLYTDGLVEAHRDLERGLAELPEHARALRVRPPAVVAERLVALMLAGRPPRDDTLVVAVRRTRRAEVPGGRVHERDARAASA